MSRRQSFLITAAGPAIQICLGAIVFVLLRYVPGLNENGAYFLKILMVISFVWAIINLLPVLPLDGGQMLNAALGPASHQDHALDHHRRRDRWQPRSCWLDIPGFPFPHLCWHVRLAGIPSPAGKSRALNPIYQISIRNPAIAGYDEDHALEGRLREHAAAAIFRRGSPRPTAGNSSQVFQQAVRRDQRQLAR